MFRLSVGSVWNNARRGEKLPSAPGKIKQISRRWHGGRRVKNIFALTGEEIVWDKREG
jgi:hypothetical protein